MTMRDLYRDLTDTTEGTLSVKGRQIFRRWMCIESQGRTVLCGSENNKEAKWLQRSEREERGSKLRLEGVEKHSHPILEASKDVGTHRKITSSLCH